MSYILSDKVKPFFGRLFSFTPEISQNMGLIKTKSTEMASYYTDIRAVRENVGAKEFFEARNHRGVATKSQNAHTL